MHAGRAWVCNGLGRARLAVLAFALVLSGCGGTSMPPAVPALSGTIRVSGSPADAGLLATLEAGFQRRHPEIAFTHALHGPESTLAGVYTGTADLALMGRELREPLERMAFEWVLLDKPLVIDVAHAGLAAERPSAQLGVFVHKSNPLQRLSLRQLDAIYGAEHLRGGPNLRRWGDLGLDDAWAARAIHVYGPAVDSVPALYLRRTVLHDSRKWNPDYRQTAADGAAIAALAQDQAGIAYAPLREAIDAVKLLALAEEDAGPFHLPDAGSVRSRAYPLARSIAIVTAHTRTRPMPAHVRAFVDYLLSDAGQAAIAADGRYLPLGEASLRAQRERLP